MQPGNTIYTILLEASLISYTTDYPYLLAGPKAITQKWALHISVIPLQMAALLESMLPLLAKEKLAYSMPCTSMAHQQILDGLFGDGLIGQVINIYPATEGLALELAKQFAAITKHYRGPAVPFCANYGGGVYVSFRQPPRQKKLIGCRYLPVTIIKNDVKGRVKKCLDVSGWKHLQWVLVKEGLRDMCTDNEGRDIRDRLRWQYEILKAIEDCRIAPRVFGFFEWEGNAYLAMEYIEGITLHDVINNIYCGRAYSMLSATERKELHLLLLKVIAMVESLHRKGYIHRDLTPHNFIITKTRELLFIDMELAYSTATGCPLPPFALGSRGYMSPEQEALQPPQVAEDMFGLGAMMMALFTGLSPTRFDRSEAERLQTNLLFFTGIPSLATIIVRCQTATPAERPTLAWLKTAAGAIAPERTACPAQEAQAAPGLIERALRGLCSPLFTDAGQLWWSYEGGRPVIDTGLHKGIAGILYLFEAVKTAGYNTTPFAGVLEKNRDYLNAATESQSQKTLKELLRQAKKLRYPGLIDGRAGSALILLRYAEQSGDERTEKEAVQLLNGLLKVAKNAARTMPPWFGEGFTGLAFVLIQAYKILKHGRLKTAAEQLLYLHPAKTVANSPTIAEGLAGIGETYLEAWQVFGDNVWKERADWIAAVLRHTYISQPDGAVYWHTGPAAQPAAGLIDGNAGIIHFLLRCEHQDLPFPIFNTLP